MRFIESLKLAGLLSFPPDMEPFELESLNVLIGPNGSGNSRILSKRLNCMRALHETDLSAAFRNDGGAMRVDMEGLWRERNRAN